MQWGSYSFFKNHTKFVTYFVSNDYIALLRYELPGSRGLPAKDFHEALFLAQRLISALEFIVNCADLDGESESPCPHPLPPSQCNAHRSTHTTTHRGTQRHTHSHMCVRTHTSTHTHTHTHERSDTLMLVFLVWKQPQRVHRNKVICVCCSPPPSLFVLSSLEPDEKVL
jgi:hypothetical protein